ncbi:MAG: N-acetylglucosamine kinase [Salinivenus sp.]
MPSPSLSIGLDVGGSTSVLVAEDSRASGLVRRTGPAANPQRIGMEETARILVDLVREGVRRPVADGQLSVCAGVAGAGQADEQAALADRLRSALLGMAATVQVCVLHDAQIALEAAFGDDSGVIVVAGTGSVGVARTQTGAVHRVGGWGYLLGDPGSGYALGRAGLRAVVRMTEGGAQTALRDKVQRRFGLDSREEFIRTVYDDAFRVQEAAPLVLEAAADGDAVASRILMAQVDELAQQVAWLIGQCDAVRPRMALLGGMTKNDHYLHCLRQALSERLAGWAIERLTTPPVMGALNVARRRGQ